MTETHGLRLLESDKFDELMAMLNRCFAYEGGGRPLAFHSSTTGSNRNDTR